MLNHKMLHLLMWTLTLEENCYGSVFIVQYMGAYPGYYSISLSPNSLCFLMIPKGDIMSHIIYIILWYVISIQCTCTYNVYIVWALAYIHMYMYMYIVHTYFVVSAYNVHAHVYMHVYLVHQCSDVWFPECLFK